MAVLDGAIANVALPTIAGDLNTSPANSIWVVNAYQLAVTISLLPLSSLGDIFGYRRVYQWGLVAFTVASLGCALSWSLPTLAIARVFQGFGAAGIMSVNGALVRAIYPRRLDWTRTGHQRDDRLDRVRRRSDRRRRHPFGRQLALAVRDQRASRRDRRGDCLACAAGDAQFGGEIRRAAALMSAVSLGVLITAIDGIGHGERLECGAFRGRRRAVRRAVAGDARTQPELAAGAGRPDAYPAVRAVGLTSICAFTAQ